MGYARVVPDDAADTDSGNSAVPGSHSLSGSLGGAGSVGGEVPANRRFGGMSGRAAARAGFSSDTSPMGSG